LTGIANYAPDEVNVLVAGIIPISGFTNGSFIRINKMMQPFESRRTADGRVMRLYNRDATYEVALTLHSASPSNDVLTKLWQLDEITQKGKFPLLIKDQSGSDLFFSTTTWIEQVPVMDKDVTINDKIWVLKSSQAFINIGGNASASSLIQDLINTATSALPTLEGIL